MQSNNLTENQLQESLLQIQQRKSRLYWQCRRGMLELDSLLQGFFKLHIDSLSEQQLVSFEALLKSPDDLLLEYLMGRMVPMDAGVADVVAEIRQSITV